MKRLFLIWFLLVATLPLWAVETILVGTVYDAATHSPLENVSVYFKGTKVGTTTRADGIFYLHVNLEIEAKLVISAVGYRRQQYDIAPGRSAGIEVLLEEKINQLATIAAMPGENPAIPLMAEVRAHRRDNDRTEEASLDGDTRYFISDIQPRHLRRKLWKNLEGGMVQLADSSYLMPLPERGFSAYMVPLPEHLNFYDSHLPFLSTSFLSPLAASANSFYRFYLMDSVVVGDGVAREKHYRVHFLPKNSFNPTLSGVLEIDSATYALRRVQASVPREANINYLSSLQYNAAYAADNRLADEQLAALMDIAVKSDTSRLFPSLLATRSSRADGITLLTDTLLHPDSAVSAFLSVAEPATTIPSLDDSLSRALQDSLTSTPLYRFAHWLGELCYTGYIPTGTPVDIGRVTDIISVNPHERLHLGLPFRTNARLCPYFSVGGYVGYGLRDHAVKYMAEMHALLPTERRHMISLEVSDRYAYTEVSGFDGLRYENSITGTNLRFTSYLLNNIYYNSATAYNSAARRREVRLTFDDDWMSGQGSRPAVETRLSVQLGRQSYGNPMLYHYYDMPSYRYASVRAMVRLGWHERVADIYTTRRYLYSSYPTLYIGAEMGSYSLDAQSVGAPSLESTSAHAASAYRMYGILHAILRQDISLGMGGTLSYVAEAGVVLGSVPYPLLALVNGNQSYSFSPERFTFINNYQFAADRYLFLQMSWDGRGILFNQIPGVRYARLHELVEAKLAYGGLSDRHRDVIPYPDGIILHSLSTPYAEVGVGIGNILRLVDVYSIWRLTNRDDLSAARWGIRFRVHLGL